MGSRGLDSLAVGFRTIPVCTHCFEKVTSKFHLLYGVWIMLVSFVPPPRGHRVWATQNGVGSPAPFLGATSEARCVHVYMCVCAEAAPLPVQLDALQVQIWHISGCAPHNGRHEA